MFKQLKETVYKKKKKKKKSFWREKKANKSNSHPQIMSVAGKKGSMESNLTR